MHAKDIFSLCNFLPWHIISAGLEATNIFHSHTAIYFFKIYILEHSQDLIFILISILTICIYTSGKLQQLKRPVSALLHIIHFMESVVSVY